MTAPTVEQIEEALTTHAFKPDVASFGSGCEGCDWRAQTIYGRGEHRRHLAEQVAALGVRAGDPRDVAHIECDCVPDIGPSHCHLCSVRAGREMPWAEAHPSEVEWGVRWPWGQGPVEKYHSRQEAEREIRRNGPQGPARVPGVLVSRIAPRPVAPSPWVEVTDEGGEGA
ncbi:hypothetical protein CHO01_22000 [Cellulomonas hominis]|uniref:Uncharacterized protein n=1 Tax=Cellulomonas hominis TaxID=156981 RepID=A0A511FER1_9CELL|nr:hypothetical protein [Cellulomonas hominis]MBB5474675.1 hypothetical protein [Cellulomonas hominis]NKY05845.1 hypothetical protein [Cellulomonas hominis]GEL47084.1 hypothetical protein CHO01_22000 [Cellulomonas hominis]